MTGKAHFLAGASVGLISTYYGLHGQSDIVPLLSGTILGIIGGILPDIDTEKSMISSVFPFASKIICKITEHRGFTHTIVIPLSYMLCLLWINGVFHIPKSVLYPLIAFVIGYIMHLIQDTFTKGGVPWLFPLRFKRFSLSNARTGNKIELFVTLLLILGCLQLYSLCYTENFVKIIHL